MMASLTNWDTSLSGTLKAGPLGVTLSEVLLYIKFCSISYIDLVIYSDLVKCMDSVKSTGLF